MTTTVSFRRGFSFFLLFSIRLAAQTGGIGGTVKDPSGGAVTNAAVALIDQDTNARQAQTTAGAGAYTFPQVQPGRYRLEAEAPGFKKFIQSDIAIDVQQRVAIDPVLQIGQATESIEVAAQTPLLQPNTSSLGQVVSNREIS